MKSPVDGHGLVLPTDHASRAAYLHYLAKSHEALVRSTNTFPSLFRDEITQALPTLRALVAQHGARALLAYGHPAVGAPLWCLPLRSDLPAFSASIEQASAKVLPHLAIELSSRNLLEDKTFVTHAEPLELPPFVYTPPKEIAFYRFRNQTIELLDAQKQPRGQVSLNTGEGPSNGTSTQRFHRLFSNIFLAEVDPNPIASFEAHPNKDGNAIQWSDKSPQEWSAPLIEAFALIEEHLPTVHEEMKWLLRRIVPVGFDEVRHLSASYREAVGTIYLTLHPRAFTLAEALVHEFQHNKLNAAAYGASFLENAFFPLYPSPVRPDPRPLWGILLAVHAFLPVAELFRRMRSAQHPFSTHPDFLRRLDEIDGKNREGLAMLAANAQWTTEGRKLFDELQSIAAAHDRDRSKHGQSSAPLAAHTA